MKCSNNFYRNKEILVTGGASFIGSHLVDALVEQEGRVTVVDDLSSGRSVNLERSLPRIHFVKGDLRIQDTATQAMRDKEIVFHLANIHGGRGFIETHPGEIVQNMVIDGNIFYGAQESGVSLVCFASSACVYPTNLQTEDKSVQQRYLSEEMADPFKPGCALPDGEYGWAKFMGELALKAYHKQFGLKGVSCRLFTVYGPRENESHAVMALLAKAYIRQDPYEVWGSGRQDRNFTYVSDAVEGMMLAAEHIDDCRAVNIGTDEVTSVTEAARIICETAGYRPERICFNTSKPEGVHARAASVSINT